MQKYIEGTTLLKQTSLIIWASDIEDAILFFYDWSKSNLDLDFFLSLSLFSCIHDKCQLECDTILRINTTVTVIYLLFFLKQLLI